MKKSLLITALLVAGANLHAQKQSDALPFHKDYIDSLSRLFPNINPRVRTPEFNMPYTNRPGKTNSFETMNPGATFINKTSRGTIYNMPLDNMALLVPGMDGVERMPVSRFNNYSTPRNNMPNPLYPGNGLNRKAK